MYTSRSRVVPGPHRRARGPSRHAALAAALVVLGAIAACTKSGNLDPGRYGLDKSMVCIEPKSNQAKDVVCSRWACAHANLVAARWDGDALRCAPGMIDERAHKTALGLVNAYRFLAGVPEIEPEPRWDGPAQECALLAHANKKLSHTPTRDWACWSDRGARASGVSLVANRSAPLAIDAFIEDPGNDETMVHRRWLLSEKVHRLGLGSTSGYTCALVDGRQWDAVPPPRRTGADAGATADAGAGPVEKGAEIDAGVDPNGGGASAEEVPEPSAGTELEGDTSAEKSAAEPREWVAWPPPGPVPIDAIRRTRVDDTGWTIQSSSLDLDEAIVEVRVAGQPRPLKVLPLERTMGSLTAIRFLPKGWWTKADERYDVHLTKGDTVIDFTVEPIMCP